MKFPPSCWYILLLGLNYFLSAFFLKLKIVAVVSDDFE
jgi:hypothetical protein